MKKSASILDFSYPFLDPAVWDQDMHLFAYQRDFILRLIDKMYDTYGLKEHEKWVEDAVLLGSLCTSKWLLSSDLDVHIRVNLDAFIETNMPGVSKEEAFAKLDTVRKEFDRAKILLPMTQHPAEFYFESADIKSSNEEMVGVYSLMQDKWLKAPILFEAGLDLEESKKSVVEAAEALAKELDSSLGTIKRDIQRVDELETIIKAWDKEKQQLFYKKIETKLNNIEEEIKKDLKIKQDLVEARHENMSATSDTELTFKYLQRYGFFGIFSQLKKLLEETGGEVTTEDLPLIEKVISEASLNKESAYDFRSVAMWIDPNGQVYPVRTTGDKKNTHVEWIYQNQKLLKDKYNFSLPSGLIDDMKRGIYNYNTTNKELVMKGWTRVDGANIEVYDIHNVPNFVFDLPFMPEEYVWIEDLNHDYVQEQWKAFQANGQKTINQSLSQKRLQPVSSLNKQAGSVIDVNGVRVYKNPSFHQVENLWEKSKYKYLKAVVDPRTHEIFVWDANDLHHTDMMISLGIPDDPEIYDNFTWDLSEFDDIDAMFSTGGDKHKIEKPNIIHYTSSLKQAFLKEAFEDEKLVLAIDFDDTLAKENPDHSIGEPEPGAKEALIKLKNDGYTLEIYSHRANTEKGADEIKEWMEKYEIPYDSILNVEKPLATYYIDNRGIHFTNWADVLKQVERSDKTASLHIISYTYNYRSEKVWLDPNGHWHQVGGSGSHADWIIDNAQLLKDEFGFDSSSWTRDSGGAIKDFVGLDQALVKTGWVRVGDNDSGWGIEVKDLFEVPEYLRDKLIGKHGTVIFASPDDRWVSVDIDEFVTKGQKAVTRAYNSRRLQPAFSKKELNKTAASRYWVDPSGKVYPVDDTHEDWVIDNEQLLRSQYHYDKDDIGQNWWDIRSINLLRQMLEDGWSRVGDLFAAGRKFVGTGIEVADLDGVPQSIFDFASNWSKDKYFLIEDLRRRFVELPVEELMADGQEAINRALQRGKMVHANLVVEAGDVIRWTTPKGNEIRVYKNPTSDQAENVFKNMHHLDAMRYLVSPDGDLYIWDAFYLTHDHVLSMLGYSDVDSSEVEKGEITDISKIRELISQFYRNKTSSKQASLSQKYWIDPNGKEYITSGMGHNEWAARHVLKMTTEQLKKNPNSETISFEAANKMLEDGWIRVTTETSDFSDFAVEVGNLTNISPYLDNFIANHYTGDGIELDDLQGNYVKVNDPFPYIQDAVNKALRQSVNASLDKEAYGVGNFWIDPDGKVYKVPGTHTAWGRRNAERLNAKFGYDLPLNVREGAYYTYRLIDYGWVRIADTMGNGQFIINLKDVNSIPSYVDDFIAEHFRANTHIPIWVGGEGTGGHIVLVYDPFPYIQDAVNKSLRQPVNASLNKKAEIMEINIGRSSFPVIINPTANEARGLLKKSQEQQLRYTYDQDGTSYLWDAYYGTHFDVKKELHELGFPITEEAPDEFVTGERDLSVFGSLKKKAGYDHAYWLDPNGKIFQIRGEDDEAMRKELDRSDEKTHSAWIIRNLDMLQKDYGIDPNSLTGTRSLVELGWTRIGDAYGTDWGIDVANTDNIPSFVDDAIAQFAPEGSMITVAGPGSARYQHNQSGYTFEWPVKSIQQTVQQLKNRQSRKPSPELQQAASLHKQARQNAAWIDPKGTVYQLYSGTEDTSYETHGDWVLDNRELLKKKYGIKINAPDNREDLIGNNYSDLVNPLIEAGWSRIGDIMAPGSNGYGVEVPNIQKINPAVFDYLLEHGGDPDAQITFEEHGSIYTNVLYDDLIGKGQRAVNKALRRPVMAAKAFSKKEITAQTKKVKQGEYGAIMALVPHNIAQEIVEWGVRNIKDSDVFSDEENPRLGRELEPHVTVKYGLMTDDIKSVRQFFNDAKPFKATLGKVRHFEPPEMDFDVVTVEVISKDLEEMNKKVTEHFECAEGLVSDEYHPHITVSYVKRGKGKDYVGSEAFEGKEVILDTLIISPRKGNRTYFSIGSDKESSFILEKINKFASADLGLWISPTGEIFDVHSEGLVHNEWILANLDMLERQGFKIPKGLKQEAKEYFEAMQTGEEDNFDPPSSDPVWLQMLQMGWIRVGDSGYGEVGVELKDATKIPNFLNDVLAGELHDGDAVAVEDLNHHAITVDYPFKSLQQAVNKALMNPVKVAAYRGNISLWLAPDGKEFPIGQSSHSYWIIFNFKMLQERYKVLLGYTEEEFKKEVENGSGNYVVDQLLHDGWIRVDGHLPTEIDLQIDNVHNIPQVAEQFVWKYKPEMVIIEDLNGNDTSFDREEYSKGMMKKASSNIQDINGVRVYRNPTPDQAINLLKQSKEHALRYIATDDDIYMWDAYFSDHRAMAEQLGVSEDPSWYDSAGTAITEENAKDKAELFTRHSLELQPTAKKAEFLPSLFPAPDNRYQFEHGGDDKQLAVNVDPISDDETLYGEWWQDKPRSPECWKAFISMFRQPMSKKENMTVEAGEAEEWDSHYGDIWKINDKVKLKNSDKIGIIKEINGNEIVTDNFKTTTDNIVSVDQSTFDYPHNTQWFQNYQGVQEPDKVTPVTYSPEMNPEFDKQNSPGGYPNRFCRKPESEWFSDEGEIVPALKNMWKNREAAINRLTLDITASYTHAYWIDPNGKVFQVRGDNEDEIIKNLNRSNEDTHGGWATKNYEMLERNYGFTSKDSLTSSNLIEHGWIRIGDSHRYDWGVSVKDLNNIPSSVDNLLAQFAPEGSKIVIGDNDSRNQYVVIEWPVKSVQQAVQQALKQPVYALLDRLTIDITSSRLDAGGWISPSGKYIEAPDHFRYVDQHLDEFELSKLKSIPDAYERMTAIMRSDQYIYDQGWIRARVMSEVLRLQGNTFQNIKDHAEEFIYKHLNDVERIWIALNDDLILETSVEEFKEKGWDAFSKTPVMAKQAAMGFGMWMSPTGEIIDVSSHPDYAFDNAKELGLQNIPTEITEENAGETYRSLMEQMFEKGWVRLRLMSNELDIELYDLENIPDMINDFIIEHPTKQIRVQNAWGDDATVDYDSVIENGIQKAVNLENVELEQVAHLKKQAGSYSSTYSDEQGNEFKNEQLYDGVDDVPYIDKNNRDYPFGMRDMNDSSTDYPKPEDIQPYVVRLDILYPGPERPYPAGMMDYEVINMYDSLPASDSLEATNPD